jgi:hypothetical protein
VPSNATITRDTTLCVSLAARPSNIGTRFHNFLYDELALDFVYKAFAPADLEAAVAGIRGLGIRGAGVSMPFKEACIPLLDELDPSASAIDSVNTIVNDSGRLRGYNTDYLAVQQVLAAHEVPPELEFAVLGNGGWPRPSSRPCAMPASPAARWWRPGPWTRRGPSPNGTVRRRGGRAAEAGAAAGERHADRHGGRTAGTRPVVRPRAGGAG